jgi:ATP-dependent DNA ligase
MQFRPFDGADWIFESKHDGFRVVAIRDSGSTRLFSRNGYEISANHPNITGQFNALPAKRATNLFVQGNLLPLCDPPITEARFNGLRSEATGLAGSLIVSPRGLVFLRRRWCRCH